MSIYNKKYVTQHAKIRLFSPFDIAIDQLLSNFIEKIIMHIVILFKIIHNNSFGLVWPNKTITQNPDFARRA